DVDEPLLGPAHELGIDYQQLDQDQTDLFRLDMQHFHGLAPSHYLAVAEPIDWLRTLVRQMMDAVVTYLLSGEDQNPDRDIYLSIDAAEAKSDWHLGVISAHAQQEMIEFFPERGGDPQRPGKRNPLDPLIWSAYREGEPFWHDDVLGTGRPGWHVECSAIA